MSEGRHSRRRSVGSVPEKYCTFATSTARFAEEKEEQPGENGRRAGGRDRGMVAERSLHLRSREPRKRCGVAGTARRSEERVTEPRAAEDGDGCVAVGDDGAGAAAPTRGPAPHVDAEGAAARWPSPAGCVSVSFAAPRQTRRRKHSGGGGSMTRGRSLALGAQAPWKQVRWRPFGGTSASSRKTRASAISVSATRSRRTSRCSTASTAASSGGGSSTNSAASLHSPSGTNTCRCGESCHRSATNAADRASSSPAPRENLGWIALATCGN